MRRLLIFAAFGPLFGFLTVMASIQLLNVAVDGSFTLSFGQLVLLPAAYVLGIVPALITAGFDHALRRARYRVLWTSLFAYFAGFVPVLTALLMGFLSTWYVLFVGLVGLVPGAICSWLSPSSSLGQRRKTKAATF
jgi:hypothetical protein